MNETSILGLATCAGGALGVIFFGGLWWTIRAGLPSHGPGLWFFASFTVRMSIALAGFFLVTRGDWRNASVCLLGFLAARSAVVRLTGTRLARTP